MRDLRRIDQRWRNTSAWSKTSHASLPSRTSAAERLGASIVLTLDRRHFAAIAPRHRAAFDLLP